MGKKNIFWIDDREDQLVFYKEFLEIEGYSVEFCKFCEDIENKLKDKNCFDLVILDIMMMGKHLAITGKSLKDNPIRDHLAGIEVCLPIIKRLKTKFIIFSVYDYNSLDTTIKVKFENLKRFKGYYHKLTVGPEQLAGIIGEIV